MFWHCAWVRHCFLGVHVDQCLAALRSFTELQPSHATVCVGVWRLNGVFDCGAKVAQDCADVHCELVPANGVLKETCMSSVIYRSVTNAPGKTRKCLRRVVFDHCQSSSGCSQALPGHSGVVVCDVFCLVRWSRARHSCRTDMRVLYHRLKLELTYSQTPMCTHLVKVSCTHVIMMFVPNVTLHVTEMVRPVLGTGQDESRSLDEATLWPLAEREQLLIFACTHYPTPSKCRCP